MKECGIYHQTTAPRLNGNEIERNKCEKIANRKLGNNSHSKCVKTRHKEKYEINGIKMQRGKNKKKHITNK